MLDYQGLSLSWPRAASLIALHLLALLALWFFSWQALGIAIALHWLCGSVGVCLGYRLVLTPSQFEIAPMAGVCCRHHRHLGFSGWPPILGQQSSHAPCLYGRQ